MAGSGQDQLPQSQINLHTEPPAVTPSATSQQPDVRADVPPNILTAGREPALLFPFSHPTPRFQRGFQTRAILGSVPCPCLPSTSPSPQAKPERVRGSVSQSHTSTHHTDITLSSPYTNPYSLVWTCVHTDTASMCAKWQTQAPRGHSVLGGAQGWRSGRHNLGPRRQPGACGEHTHKHSQAR